MEDTITLKKVIEWMDAGLPFDIKFITWDHRKEDGGDEIYIEKAWKHNHRTTAEKRALEKQQPTTGVSRNPNHYSNSTRNIRIDINGDIRKVHLRLIRRFNGKTVL